jgi:NADPH:quinone reductase-like Zn-dependent oxidoreductase
LPILPGAHACPSSHLTTNGANASPPGFDASTGVNLRAFLDEPIIPGYAISGEVDAVGVSVEHVMLGEPVIGALLAAFLVNKHTFISVNGDSIDDCYVSDSINCHHLFHSALLPMSQPWGGCAQFAVVDAINVGMMVNIITCSDRVSV